MYKLKTYVAIYWILGFSCILYEITIDYNINNSLLQLGIIFSFIYFLSYFFIRIITVSESGITIFYPTRLLKRKINVKYSDIKNIYLHMGRPDFIKITLHRKRWKFSPIIYLISSFIVSGKKLMDIYNLIKSKDVKIKVAGGNVKNVFEGKKYD
jgi:hypothetical protein